MSQIAHYIAYDQRRLVTHRNSPVIFTEEWRAESFRADDRWRVEGPFVPAEQLREAVEALREIAEADPVDMALDPTWAARVAREAWWKVTTSTTSPGQSVAEPKEASDGQ